MLWDIDNTLLYTGGAGSIGMTRAFRDLYGIDDAFGRIEFSGRTDTAIFGDAARAHGIDDERIPPSSARFLDAYIPHLTARCAKSTGGAPDAGHRRGARRARPRATTWCRGSAPATSAAAAS